MTENYSDLLADYTVVSVFLLLAIIFAIFPLVLSALIRPARPGREKLSPYECGERAIGEAQVQFSIKYYLFALLFVIFDVEAIFLFPWGVRFRELALERGAFIFWEMVIFAGILALGLAYAWRKGVLKWE